MTAVTARPLGSGEPPAEIFLSTPVFRYGLKRGMLPPWDDARNTRRGRPLTGRAA